MEIRLLGPLEVRVEDQVVKLPRRQQRALLAALALRAGEVVSTDRLVEDLWGEAPPASANGSLQNVVFGLRKLLGRHLVLTQPPGYRLAVAPEAVDALRFEALLAEARAAEGARQVELLREALALWRGAALADLAFEPFAGAEIARLEELRLGALEQRLDADLALGRHAALVPELESLVAEQPLRERLRGQLMLALYRSGRQAEALEVYRAARLALADELGLDPSPELQELERSILRQETSLSVSTETADAVPPRAQTAERRLVTVLAARPAADDDPETMQRRLDEVLAAVRESLARHGGELERFGPEGLVAVFGAAAPRDDDALRALRAAVELELPAGIATGEVVAGDRGVAGPVVTRAAGLARAAGVLLDPRTHELVRDAATTEPTGDAFRLLELDPEAQGRTRRLDAPLVGRNAELERLQAAFDAILAKGSCHVVSVLGEPGIGKTRLARELLARLGDTAEVLVARCLSSGEGATFLPLLAALRRAEPERVLLAEPDAELVAARLTALAGPDASSLGESYWAVRRLLETLGRERPVVLLLDDVHWAEPALLDLVDYLADRVAKPLFVLCLARPELERVLGEPIRLGPLAAEEAHAVARGAAELDEETRTRIVELAEGNALYIEQLAAFAAESAEGLPATLEAVLAGRLGQLAADERVVLQRAAVVGREFTRGAVAALSEVPIDPQLASLGRRGLVHAVSDAEPGDDAYSFHHVLLRDAAYATVTKRERATLHEHVAAWLDRDGPGEDALVGYHLEQAALFRHELGEKAEGLAAAAGERLGHAGMRAARHGDVVAAAALLRRACALLPEGLTRGVLLCESAAVLRSTGDNPAATAALLEAREIDAPLSQARAKLEIAHERAILNGEDPIATFQRVTAEVMPTLEKHGDARSLGRAWMLIGDAHAMVLQHEEWGQAARRGAEYLLSVGWLPTSAYLQMAAVCVYGPTPVSEGIARCHELLHDARDSRIATAAISTRLADLLAMAERNEEAATLLEDSKVTFEEFGDRLLLTNSWGVGCSRVLRLAGDGRRAFAVLDDACAALEEMEQTGFLSTRTGELAALALELGAHDEAQRLVDRGRAISPADDIQSQTLWRGVQARLDLLDGRARSAMRLADEAAELVAATDGLNIRAWTQLVQSETVRDRDPARADDLAGGAQRLYVDKGNLAELRLARERGLLTSLTPS